MREGGKREDGRRREGGRYLTRRGWAEGPNFLEKMRERLARLS